jgi:hypothetical protein
LAREEPATGVPDLAVSLLAFGWRMDRARPAERLPYFEEAAEIYRSLLALGSIEHIEAAVAAISSLALQYSFAHADDRALAARSEAVALARKLSHRDGIGKVQGLGVLAHGLAEAGQFAQAVDLQAK